MACGDSSRQWQWAMGNWHIEVSNDSSQLAWAAQRSFGAIHMRSAQRAADSISKASAGRERPPQADFFLQRLALFAKEAGRIGARQQRHGRLVGGVAMGARPALSPGLTGAAAPTSID